MHTQEQTDGYIQGLHRAGTVYAHTGTDGYIQGLHRAGTVYTHRNKLTVDTGQGQFMHTRTN